MILQKNWDERQRLDNALKNIEKIPGKERLRAWASEQNKGSSHELRIWPWSTPQPVVILRDVSLKSTVQSLQETTGCPHAVAHKKRVLQPFIDAEHALIHWCGCSRCVNIDEQGYLNQILWARVWKLQGNWLTLKVDLAVGLTSVAALVPRAEIDDIYDSHVGLQASGWWVRPCVKTVLFLSTKTKTIKPFLSTNSAKS